MKTIKPTTQNSLLLAETLNVRVNKAIKERYPTAEDLIGFELNKKRESIFK